MSGAEPSLVEKVIAVDDSLTLLGVSHAFGGALALAYYTREPRATVDIDVNISVEARDAERVLEGLPDGVEWSPSDLRRVRADEQVRLWWGRTPIDLFFRASDFHDGVEQRVVVHDFGNTQLPFLSALDLAVFKALFDRPKDWLDITAMRDAGAIEIADVAGMLHDLVGDDTRVSHLRSLGTAH